MMMAALMMMMMMMRPSSLIVHVLLFFRIIFFFLMTTTYHMPPVNADTTKFAPSLPTLATFAPPPLPPLLPGHTILNGTNTTDDIVRVCLASNHDPSLKPQCEGALYENVQVSVDVYTLALAEKFSFCIHDPIRERNATFGFDGNLTFLSNCFDETSGLIMQYMCTGAEIKAYLNSLVYIIQGGAKAAASASITDINCNQSSWSNGCEPGWAKSQSEIVTNMSHLYQDDTRIPVRTSAADLPCCDGFFCPRSLGCMMPCPLGAQCTKTTLVGGLCAPYNYPLTPGVGFSCGGANLWASLSVSSGLFCPPGSYCPSTSDVRPCDKGHFCRQGSTAQTKCFQLTNCDEQSTTQHIQTYGVILILGMALIVIFMYKCSNRIRKVRRERKDKMREKAIRQVKERFSAAKKWRSAASVVKKLGRTISGVPRNSINGQSLHSSSMVRSERASFRIQSSNNGERRFNELENMEDSRRSSGFTDVEQELYEAPESSQGKRSKLHSRSQILRYAYGQIEIEKAMQSKPANWKELVQVVGRDQARISNDRLKIEIAFNDLSLFLKSNGKKILCNVTGKLSPGRVTAVMGPSGAGKTTFLNALAGKAYNSYTTGVVLINGKPDPIKCYKKIIGFVAQDDIVHGNLTVEENLWFSARYRLPVGMPKPEKVLVVERIIDALGLEQIRSSKVGSVEKRGISGGQRKRVNVGLEMVMEPSLLILDEPTSGLDSTSSFLVLRALRREAHVGVNVGVVLHQPSYGLFRMFDDVMFLAKGGRTVYLGPVDEVEDYFASMGIIVPERINPPDHFMDVLEGITRPGEQQPFDPTILPLKWIQHKGYDVSRDLLAASESEAYSLEIRSQGPNARSSWSCRCFVQDLWVEFTSFIGKHWDEFKSTFTRYEDLSMRRTPGFFRQYKMIVSRLALQRIREARLQTQDYFILLLCGAGLGVIVPTTDASLGSSNYAFVIIALSLLCMVASLRTFTNDKLQFWRESASGINRVAYFLAKDTMDLFNVAIKPVVFLSMFYFFNNSRSTFAENYVVTLALVYCVTGIAYIFAVIMDSSPAQLWSVFLPIIATLLATKRKLPTLLRFIPYANYARWALEAYVIANAKRYGGVWLITRCALLYSTKYDIKNWALCLGILFGMGFVTRFIALLCLILCNRRRQQ